MGKVGSQLDPHLLNTLLDHLSENELYSGASLLEAKLKMLAPTKMAEYEIEIYQQLHDGAAPPQGAFCDVPTRVFVFEGDAQL